MQKQIERNGLKKGELTIEENAILDIIRYYTREAGVRGLEREISKICRKAVKNLLVNPKVKSIIVNSDNLHDYLGVKRFEFGKADTQNRVGEVTGLAWTEVGGDLLTIETASVVGKGKLTFTGSLGDVMKESAQAGISYIRSISSKYKVAEDFFEKHDIHIHIPEGAVPKDGPSAGITMATAIMSAVTGRKVRADLAMTGEITLRGRVLPIGGLKEKLLAAKNAGMKTVCIPKENEQDLAEISEEIVGDMEIIPVEHMDQVIKAAFV